MNKMKNQGGVISSFFNELNGLSSQELGGRISAFMDEQPHLTGFLFNLDDDFSEEAHTFLLKASIAVRDVLVGAGIPLGMINNETIEQVVQEKVEQYDTLTEEEKPLNEYVHLSSSPQMLEAVLKQFDKTDENLILIVDVIISLLEESAADAEDRKEVFNG